VGVPHPRQIQVLVFFTRSAGQNFPRSWTVLSHAWQLERKSLSHPLVGFSHLAPSDLQPLGKRVSLGAVVGFNLTGDYNSTSSTGQDLISGSPVTFLTRSGARSLIVGPSIEVALLKRLSIEADAIHENVRSVTTVTGPVQVELGPSFRIPQTVTNYGATAGGGGEMPVSKLKVAPELRYTRWQSDPVGGGKANQAKLLMGISF
jgi:hypothetical protein